jgi:hypothetical protein
MSYAREMLGTHPGHVDQSTVDLLIRCIEECFNCAQSCTSCADACLGEEMVAHLTYCIRLNLDCADVCTTTGRMLSRQTKPNWEVIRSQLSACAAVCKACGSECGGHADEHEHCRVCAEACRRCEGACDELLQALRSV